MTLATAVFVLIGLGMWVCGSTPMASSWWQSGRASVLIVVALGGTAVVLAALWRAG